MSVDKIPSLTSNSGSPKIEKIGKKRGAKGISLNEALKEVEVKTKNIATLLKKGDLDLSKIEMVKRVCVYDDKQIKNLKSKFDSQWIKIFNRGTIKKLEKLEKDNQRLLETIQWAEKTLEYKKLYFDESKSNYQFDIIFSGISEMTAKLGSVIVSKTEIEEAEALYHKTKDVIIKLGNITDMSALQRMNEELNKTINSVKKKLPENESEDLSVTVRKKNEALNEKIKQLNNLKNPDTIASCDELLIQINEAEMILHENEKFIKLHENNDNIFNVASFSIILKGLNKELKNALEEAKKNLKKRVENLSNELNAKLEENIPEIQDNREKIAYYLDHFIEKEDSFYKNSCKLLEKLTEELEKSDLSKRDRFLFEDLKNKIEAASFIFKDFKNKVEELSEKSTLAEKTSSLCDILLSDSYSNYMKYMKTLVLKMETAITFPLPMEFSPIIYVQWPLKFGPILEDLKKNGDYGEDLNSKIDLALLNVKKENAIFNRE